MMKNKYLVVLLQSALMLQQMVIYNSSIVIIATTLYSRPRLKFCEFQDLDRLISGSSIYSLIEWG